MLSFPDGRAERGGHNRGCSGRLERAVGVRSRGAAARPGVGTPDPASGVLGGGLPALALGLVPTVTVAVAPAGAATWNGTVDWNDVRQTIDGFGGSTAFGMADQVMSFPTTTSGAGLLPGRRMGRLAGPRPPRPHPAVAAGL